MHTARHDNLVDAIPSAPGSPGTEDEPPTRTSWHFPHQLESVSAARRTAVSATRKWHLGQDTTHNLRLVVSELVTNAVLHAAPPVVLHLRHEPQTRHLWVGVTDGGGAAAAARAPLPDDEHGRGLFLVTAVADDTGAEPADCGTTWWARLSTA
ncbi:ATP-binding protein [Streptomyces sp. NPDC002952]|uniref:ATP-binding protein n=1 Tax=Streptomyces sp. NPDC002952 TaxID=3364673 RepID=UPI00367EE054